MATKERYRVIVDSHPFRTRVWRRLRALGMTDSDISRVWRCNTNLPGYYLGFDRQKQRRARRVFIARVWSRLIAKPFSMTQRSIAALWGVSPAYVCVEIRAVRYEMLRVA